VAWLNQQPAGVLAGVHRYGRCASLALLASASSRSRSSSESVAASSASVITCRSTECVAPMLDGRGEVVKVGLR
jgi:hypothetical protein